MTAPDSPTGEVNARTGTRPTGRVRVLITRPADQAQGLADACVQLGLVPQLMPTLSIEPVSPPDDACVPEQGLAIFTSANAVRHARQLAPLPWPAVATLAIGRATAVALADAGQPLLIPPVPPFTSEALIAVLRRDPPAALADGVTLVTGEDGRGWMIDRLRDDGHRVTVISVYRRIVPPYDVATLDALLVPTPDVITSSSDAALDNLLVIAAHRGAQLRRCPLIVNSDRCARYARERGFEGPILVASEAGDNGQLEQLRRLSTTLVV